MPEGLKLKIDCIYLLNCLNNGSHLHSKVKRRKVLYW